VFRETWMMYDTQDVVSRIVSTGLKTGLRMQGTGNQRGPKNRNLYAGHECSSDVVWHFVLCFLRFHWAAASVSHAMDWTRAWGGRGRRPSKGVFCNSFVSAVGTPAIRFYKELERSPKRLGFAGHVKGGPKPRCGRRRPTRAAQRTCSTVISARAGLGVRPPCRNANADEYRQLGRGRSATEPG